MLSDDIRLHFSLATFQVAGHYNAFRVVPKKGVVSLGTSAGGWPPLKLVAGFGFVISGIVIKAARRPP
jgi:hypothetical protein